jgi:phosphomannomutase
VIQQLKIGTSWVRGIVGQGLTPELIVDFASAFGTWVEGRPVVIGRDTRRSSVMLRAAVVSGLLSPGSRVIDMGISTTPLVCFAVRELGAAGGICITGSHNDAAWNALKFIGPHGGLLTTIESEELLDIYHASTFKTAPRDHVPNVAPAPEIGERYIEHLLSILDLELIKKRRFRLAVDFNNGASADISRRFLKELACDVIPVNEELTGQFAHPPAPSISNMAQLAEVVSDSEVELGACINVDGDRIGFVTEKGQALSEEYTIALAALNRLSRRSGPIVTSFSTSHLVDIIAEKHHQKVIRTIVGESHVVDRGLEEGAILAGEGSGGVAALPLSTTFDGLLTLGMVLESLAAQQDGLSGLVSHLPHSFMKKGELTLEPVLAYRAVRHFREAYAEMSPDCSDGGVRVAWEDAWLHVRVSNTEPLLRMIVEAREENRANQLYEEAMVLAEQSSS